MRCLKETPSRSCLQLTEWNVRHSDGRAIFTLAPELAGGSKRGADLAESLARPWVHIAQAGIDKPAAALRRFVKAHQTKVLNVAGSRERKEPRIYLWVYAVLEDAFFWSQRNPGTLGGPGEG